MREAWRAQKAVIAQNTNEQQQSHLEQVLALWKAKVTWWEQDFTNWEAALKDKSSSAETAMGAVPLEEAEDEVGDMFEPPTPRRQAASMSVMAAAPTALANESGQPSDAKKKGRETGTVATIQIVHGTPKRPTW